MTESVGLDWKENDRWKGIVRPYRPSDVERLRGSLPIAHTLATLGAQRLWRLLQTEPYLPTLGAMTGTQAVQMVAAGLPAIYASGWQVAADANDADETYPDQSLYPADSMPNLVRRINNALRREDEKNIRSGRTTSSGSRRSSRTRRPDSAATSTFSSSRKGSSTAAPRACTSRTSSPR